MVRSEDPPEIEAFFEALSGASQAFKLGATDGATYAVKFREKAQAGRLGLARELLAAALAKALAVNVPEGRVLMLTQDFLDLDQRLAFTDLTRPAPGLASASRFLTPAANLPPDHTARLAICPSSDVAGVLVFNSWIGCDDRGWNNYAFSIEGAAPRFASIDYATAFGRAPASPPQIQDVAEVQAIARSSWPAVDSMLTRLENLPDAEVDLAFRTVPDEFWSQTDRDAMLLMLRTSRMEVRSAIERIRP